MQTLNGYTFVSSFQDDFNIADIYGLKAVKDTYLRAFREWKDNYIYLTELVIILNWKIWEHYEKGDVVLAKLYEALWTMADEYACTHLEGEELSFFYRTTD